MAQEWETTPRRAIPAFFPKNAEGSCTQVVNNAPSTPPPVPLFYFYYPFNLPNIKSVSNFAGGRLGGGEKGGEFAGLRFASRGQTSGVLD